MARRTLSGFCHSAALVEEDERRSNHSAESFHARCPAATARPGGGVWRCQCDCHTGDEMPAPRTEIVVERAKRISTGKRNKALLEEIAERLIKDGHLELPAPEDPKECKSLRERVYTAARRKGMKVRVLVRDGQIRATRK